MKVARRSGASTPDETLASGAGRFSLAYWRQRQTEEIVESLRPGKSEALQVKSDGRVLNGNVRVKILEERGYHTDDLEREIVSFDEVSI